jgi:hypothetical protein
MFRAQPFGLVRSPSEGKLESKFKVQGGRTSLKSVLDPTVWTGRALQAEFD